MNFDTVHLISQHIEPIPLSEVERLETHLGVKLPTGYTAFITRFGLGVYCDLFRIYSPDQILKDIAQRGKLLSPFFEGTENILSEAELQDTISIGDSLDSDMLVFYPPRPDKIYVLPRHDDKIFAANADFSDLHLWDTSRLLTFVPWHRQTTLYFMSRDFTLDRASCLDEFKARWGTSLISYEDANREDWTLIFFIPAIGARVQVVYDAGILSPYAQDEQGNPRTMQGNSHRTLDIRIDCDEESAAEVNAFFAHLEAQGLITIFKPDGL